MYDYQVNATIDIAELQEVAFKAYSVYQQMLAPHHWETLKGKLSDQELLQELRAKSMLVSCTLNGRLVGAGYLVPSGNPTQIYTNEQCYIRMLGIEPEFKGNGIARRLTEMCIREARLNGETEIALHTSEFMDAARHLYESMGFVKLREIEPIFGKRYWLYRMAL